MITVQLDENKYFTGSYAKVGSIQDGVKVNSLPSDLSDGKATYYKYDEYEVEVEIEVPIQTESILIPIIDEKTGEQSIDENGELMFNTQPGEIIYEKQIVKENRLGWIFDEEKYNKDKEIKEIEEIRTQRERAFILIDKYQLILIYNELTNEQKEELASYRRAWLDATETKIIPSKPEWMI